MGKAIRRAPATLARTETCTCGLPIYRGTDDDVAGLPVTADPLALSPVGEVVALADGRATYTMEHGRLYYRYLDRISKFRHAEWAVHAGHRCNSPMPSECARTEIAPAKRPRKEIPDVPQF